MSKHFVKLKNSKWNKCFSQEGIEDFMNGSCSGDEALSYLIVNEGENWKYKWMEQDDLNG